MKNDLITVSCDETGAAGDGGTAGRGEPGRGLLPGKSALVARARRQDVDRLPRLRSGIVFYLRIRTLKERAEVPRRARI